MPKSSALTPCPGGKFVLLSSSAVRLGEPTTEELSEADPVRPLRLWLLRALEVDVSDVHWPARLDTW